MNINKKNRKENKKIRIYKSRHRERKKNGISTRDVIILMRLVVAALLKIMPIDDEIVRTPFALLMTFCQLYSIIVKTQWNLSRPVPRKSRIYYYYYYY